MGDQLGEVFAEAFLAHAYDPAKAHAYYERTKKLKGRQAGNKPANKGASTSPPTKKHRVAAIATKAAADLGPQRTQAIQKLADDAKNQLADLTEAFRKWVDSHPKATDAERAAKRKAASDEKNKIVSDLRSAVAKVSSATSKKKTPKTATEGRHH